MMMNWKQFLKQNRERHLAELMELLKIPSISALSQHKGDINQAARWLANALEKAGLEHVQVMETGGHPVVYGDWLHVPGKPTLLIYGHYDVQPVDPLDLWETPPFEPQIRHNKIYSRGASDDKGQTFMHIKAVEAILESEGKLPLNVKFCIEGEEEIGSPHLDAFVEKHQDLLAADVLLISDTPMLDNGRPAICTGLRGLCGLEITVQGPKSDLHSGMYGGGVQNPIHALVELLDSMRDPSGRITIEGFYDQVKPVSPKEREAYLAAGVNEEQIKSELAVPQLFGEEGYSFLERTWLRPTLEVNGIYGGFQGEGIKTVLPSKAGAKITCRLVPDQEPDEIIGLIQAHIKRHTPPGVTISTRLFDKGRPFVVPADHPAINAAKEALKKAFGQPAALVRMGGSIPIVETFHRILKLPVVLMGFGLSSENIHAPNEHFHLENFDRGLEAICHYWFELAGR
jgi:acetylornithine deacetylase/succinyl-diaminopimelate desuccinylase-like protein